MRSLRGAMNMAARAQNWAFDKVMAMLGVNVYRPETNGVLNDGDSGIVIAWNVFVARSLDQWPYRDKNVDGVWRRPENTPSLEWLYADGWVYVETDDETVFDCNPQFFVANFVFTKDGPPKEER